MRPDYICIDKACRVLKHIVAQGQWDEWSQTTQFIVDSYHYQNHRKTDTLCRTWCNPASTSHCPTDSFRNFRIPQESTGMRPESAGMRQEYTGMRQECTGMHRNEAGIHRKAGLESS